MTIPLLEINSLSFSYKGHPPVFNNLSLEIEQGGLIGLLGENGAGKTTLFNIIKGGSDNYEGSVKRYFTGGEMVSLLKNRRGQNLTVSGMMIFLSGMKK